MASNPITGKIEYGFKDALQRLSASVADAMAIVYNWEKICTSPDPEVTLHMHDGDHMVMTLSGLRSAVVDWAKSTTGTLIRSHFRAESSGETYHDVGPSYDTQVGLGSNYKGGSRITYWRTGTAFNEVYDMYCLSYTDDTDRFGSLCQVPRYITLNGFHTKFFAEGTDQYVHKVAIRTLQDKTYYPPQGRDSDPYAIAADVFLQNAMSSEVVIQFYSGPNFDQFAGDVRLPPDSVTHVLITEVLGSPIRVKRIA